ncbi:MAG: TIGR04255 family protein [Gemmatimonadaceae bacterium]
MATPRHLQNAPITEALIDFRVKARKAFKAIEFDALKSELSGRFPIVRERRGLVATFEFQVDKQLPARTEDLGPQGLFFATADEKTILQFRIDGFTMNRLRPYTSWQELFPVAMEMWQLYASLARPEFVTRIALRYTNQIELPPSVDAFEQYLTAPPIVPQGLPQLVSAFLTRVTIHDATTQNAVHVSQALEHDAVARRAKVILDIDAFRTVDYEPQDARIMTTLEQLHSFKNLVFFSSVTEATLSLFE